ncbi:hypothetical protein P3X46_017599 [Hevea brasiliensis]|uniref:Uncharacterized protein n=1 Tax=Hevea brasiliensis TaxID=3981 RepID=A0ABQ9LN43_HEVBR|nr:BAHD acyltransferase At5g47980-like [Hevea brasiliensis]KAJ9169397.1 hypothetical protein P3X46_017599 [Hevea brasiliensis]
MIMEIITRETIKPSFPTPIHLRNFKLSLLDQLAPVCYGPLLLFYSLNAQINPQLTLSERSRILKTSLSETLTRFYPLAGRIKDDTSIECNDYGVVFVETRINCFLSTFLGEPDAQMITKLIPIEIESPEACTGSLLQVQINCFSCGGLAIGVCISQKISDALTATIFIKDWAATAASASSSAGCGSTQQAEALLPLFNASSIFPPQNFSFKMPIAQLKKEGYVAKRFFFEASKITALKAKASSESVKNPTRVEALTGLIWKCAMNASRSNTEHFRLSILSQSVNIRRRLVPSLPEHTIGNLAGHFASLATEGDIELSSLVGQLRKGMKDFRENYVKKLQGDDAFVANRESFKEAVHMRQEVNIDFYISTSLCRFPFYGIDFGWGKPAWVTIPSGAFKNVILMMDSRDGDGIEAWVTLSEEDMAFFQRDQELLAFASLNPSVISTPITPKSSL